jgi:hypothetical protein
MQLQQTYNFEPPWKFENLFHGHKRGGSSNSFHHPFIIPSNLVKFKTADEVGSGAASPTPSLTSPFSGIITL